jgi:hypothetical protein
MGNFLAVAFSFPAVVYSVLLGVSLFYWLFVMVGAAHVNLLGDGVADGVADGIADGALEGGAKGVLEGAADHLDIGGEHADGGDIHAPGAGAGGIVASLKLRSAPATVVMSIIILFAWIFSILGMQLMSAVLPPGAGLPLTMAKLALFVLAPIVALFPTSVVVRPLARVFTPPNAPKHESLVGKVCTIRTGTVTDRFGEALLEDGGAGVVVRVRVESGEKLGRGDQVVILGYDADREEFTVAPMDDMLDEEEPPRKGRARRA